MASQAQPPIQIVVVYVIGKVPLAPFCLGSFRPSKKFPSTQMFGMFQLCVEPLYAPIYFSKPWWMGAFVSKLTEILLTNGDVNSVYKQTIS